jgi:branched-chain amino acid transport system substrate-binding protein
MSRKWAVLLCMCLGLMLIVIVGGGAGAKAAPEAAKEIRVGCSLPLSGPGASWGTPLRTELQIFVDLVNEDGGVKCGTDRYKVKVIYVDDKYTAEGAKASAEALVYREKVQFIVGVFGSAIVPNIAPTANKEKVIFVHNHPGTDFVKPAWPYVFQHISRFADSIPAEFEVMKKLHPEVKRFTALLRDDAVGAVCGRAVESAAPELEKKLGIEIVRPFSFYPFGITDFYPYLGRIQTAKIDVVWNVATPAEVALWCKQSRELGHNYLFVSHTTLTDIPSFIAVAGSKAAEAVYCQFAHVWKMPTTPPKYLKMANRICERYLKQEGKPLTYGGGFTYGSGGLSLVLEALEKAKSLDPDKIKNVLQTETFDTFMGTYKADGEKTYGIRNSFPVPTIIGKISGGEMVFVRQIATGIP